MGQDCSHPRPSTTDQTETETSSQSWIHPESPKEYRGLIDVGNEF